MTANAVYNLEWTFQTEAEIEKQGAYSIFKPPILYHN